jgi:hypothetical protein
MKNLKSLLSILFLGGGLVVLGPVAVHAVEGDAAGDCIKGEYVQDDACQGALTSMCKGPPECYKNELE